MSEGPKCIFCGIVAGRAPAHIISEDKWSLGLLDINPLAEGHCLIIPKRHVPFWHDLTEEENQSLFSLARVVAGKIMQAFQPDFVCMYARGRRIPHTHIFLVPTHSGDPLDCFFNTLEGFQEAPERLARSKDKDRMGATAGRLRASKITKEL